MKRSLIALAAATAIGTAAFAATTFADPGDGPAFGGRGMQFAHYQGNNAAPGTGWGPGMMGYGGHHPMMGAAGANVPCPGLAAAANGEPLTLDDARKAAEQRLEWLGNDRLKLGEVEAKGDDAFVAEIVTVDGSLVDTLQIDRKTGFMTPVR